MNKGNAFDKYWGEQKEKKAQKTLGEFDKSKEKKDAKKD